MGIDPTKAQIVKSCLVALFKDVRPNRINRRFIFNDGDLGCDLELDKAFIDDIPKAIGELETVKMWLYGELELHEVATREEELKELEDEKNPEP